MLGKKVTIINPGEITIRYSNLNIGKINKVVIEDNLFYYNLHSFCIPLNHFHDLPQEELPFFSYQTTFQDPDEARKMAVLLFLNYVKIIKQKVPNNRPLIYEQVNENLHINTSVGTIIKAYNYYQSPYYFHTYHAYIRIVSLYWSEIFWENKEVLYKKSYVPRAGEILWEEPKSITNQPEILENFANKQLNYLYSFIKFINEHRIL